MTVNVTFRVKCMSFYPVTHVSIVKMNRVVDLDAKAASSEMDPKFLSNSTK